MSRKYTSLEMRYMANAIRGQYGDDSEFTDAIAMLRQAADDLERERKYEYAVRFDPSKNLYALSTDYAYAKRTMDDVNADGLTICKLVRREVGEWEEVK